MTPRDWSGDRAEHDALDAGGKPGDVELMSRPSWRSVALR